MKILFFTDVHLVGKSNINRRDNLVDTQIKKLNDLKEQGILTDQEFNDKKKELLDKM